MAKQRVHEWRVGTERPAYRIALAYYAIGDFSADQRDFGFGIGRLGVTGGVHRTSVSERCAY
jgi:hypothetical protein